MEKLLTVKEIAVILNCSESSVYAWAEAGKIPAIKIVGSLRFDVQEIMDFIRKSKISQKAIQKIRPKFLSRDKTENLIDKCIASVKDNQYNNLTIEEISPKSGSERISK